MSSKPPIDVEAVFLHQTAAAILFQDPTDDDEGVWIPKSQCEICTAEPDRGDVVTLTAPEYVLLERGFL